MRILWLLGSDTGGPCDQDALHRHCHESAHLYKSAGSVIIQPIAQAHGLHDELTGLGFPPCHTLYG